MRRQPVHVLYGGAHLFSEQSPQKLASLARSAFTTYAADPRALAEAMGIGEGLAEEVWPRVRAKLENEPIEDLRIDFEDGYGVRSDAEEDETATRVGAALKSAPSLPASIGIRIKPLEGTLEKRALRTLDRVMSAMGTPPAGFVVTLPKVTRAAQIEKLCDALPDVPIEIMVEHPRALFDEQGALHLPRLVGAARGRCIAAHLGTYDYTAAVGVTAAHQRARHPAADFARQVMLASLAETDVHLSDGATTELPIPPHKSPASDEQRAENRAVVHRAFRLHHDDVRHGLALGLYQGWDLHPAQLVSRHAAVIGFFREALPAASKRLHAFLDRAAQATRVGHVFDDAATGQGLINFFLRGLASGAFDEAETGGLHLEELRTRSFEAIAQSRATPRA